MSNLKATTPERKSKYWICDDCADKKKWKGPTGSATIITGLCDWCKRTDEVFLTPCSDFSGPEGKRELWD